METVLRIPGESSVLQDQDQDSLLVKRRNDNHSPGPVITELVPSSHVLYTVCTFNLLTLMVRHGRVMLQIEKLLIAGAVEITFVF